MSQETETWGRAEVSSARNVEGESEKHDNVLLNKKPRLNNTPPPF